MASRSWNRVELIGNLTRDPELRFTPTGTAVCTFGIATNRVYISDGEKKEEVDFHRLVSWNKLAELCNQLLKKGNRVFISGRLQNRSWEDQSGQTKQITEIVVEDMILLTSKNDSTNVAHHEDISGLPPAEIPTDGAGDITASDLPTEPEAQKEKEKAKQAAPKEDIKDEELDDLPF